MELISSETVEIEKLLSNKVPTLKINFLLTRKDIIFKIKSHKNLHRSYLFSKFYCLGYFQRNNFKLAK